MVVIMRVNSFIFYKINVFLVLILIVLKVYFSIQAKQNHSHLYQFNNWIILTKSWCTF